MGMWGCGGVGMWGCGDVGNRVGGIYVILSLYIILGYDLIAPPPPLLVMLWRLRTKQGGGANRLTTYLPTRLPTKFAQTHGFAQISTSGIRKKCYLCSWMCFFTNNYTPFYRL